MAKPAPTTPGPGVPPVPDELRYNYVVRAPQPLEHIGHVPWDLLVHFFLHYIGPFDRVRCRRVCKRWNLVILQPMMMPNIGREIVTRDYLPAIRALNATCETWVRTMVLLRDVAKNPVQKLISLAVAERLGEWGREIDQYLDPTNWTIIEHPVTGLTHASGEVATIDLLVPPENHIAWFQDQRGVRHLVGCLCCVGRALRITTYDERCYAAIRLDIVPSIIARLFEQFTHAKRVVQPHHDPEVLSPLFAYSPFIREHPNAERVMYSVDRALPNLPKAFRLYLAPRSKDHDEQQLQLLSEQAGVPVDHRLVPMPIPIDHAPRVRRRAQPLAAIYDYPMRRSSFGAYEQPTTCQRIGAVIFHVLRFIGHLLVCFCCWRSERVKYAAAAAMTDEDMMVTIVDRPAEV